MTPKKLEWSLSRMNELPLFELPVYHSASSLFDSATIYQLLGYTQDSRSCWATGITADHKQILSLFYLYLSTFCFPY